MKPSVELFSLIKSLTKSEKRFFKLSSSLQSGDKNYLMLFDYIEKQTSYNETALKKKFEKENFIKHLPSEKNHLYKLIMKSLRMYASGQSIGGVLAEDLKNIEILYSKALYKECSKFVFRAKATAEKHEKFYFLYELISWEKKLIDSAYEAGEFSMDLDSLNDEEELVIAKLRNLAEYVVLYAKVNLIFRSGGFTRNENEKKIVDSIAQHPLISGKNTALSTNAASICYYIKGLCAATNRNYKDSYAFFSKTKEILDNNPLIKDQAAKRYVLTLIHLLRCYIEDKKFKKAEQMVSTIRELKSKKAFKSIDIMVQIFAKTYDQELILLHSQGKFISSVELIPEIENQHQALLGKVSKEMETLLTYSKSYSYFGIGNYKKALFYLNDVLNDNVQNLRQDIYSFSKLVNLIIHYELGNYDFIEYEVRSTSRYLIKHKRDFKIETVCIQYIRKLAKMYVVENKVELLNKMKLEIDELLKDHNESVILEYFNIRAWIKSKTDNITFSEAVREVNGIS
tara:strand:- start:13974 stop:15509 length:1536 start_codon:yes stop_codon:yes gene_type:complete